MVVVVVVVVVNKHRKTSVSRQNCRRNRYQKLSQSAIKNELLKTLRSALKIYNILLKTYTIIILKKQASHNTSIDKNYNRYDNCNFCNTFGLSRLMNKI